MLRTLSVCFSLGFGLENVSVVVTDRSWELSWLRTIRVGREQKNEGGGPLGHISRSRGRLDSARAFPGSAASRHPAHHRRHAARDRVSSYGHSRLTTPFIDGLAKRGVRFERAYSTTSWTAPAMVSMLSSTYPSQHGVVTGLVSEEADVYS